MKQIVTSIIFLVLSFTISTAQISKEGMVRYYTLNGTALDYSGNNLDGTVYGPVTIMDRFNNWRFAYSFSNENEDYIDLPNTNIELNEYSYSIWVNLSEYPKSGQKSIIFDIGGLDGDQVISYNNNYGVNEMHNGWTFHSYDINSVKTVSTNTEATLGMWYHIVAIRNLNEIKLYVNGNLISTRLVTGNADYGVTETKVYLGTRYDKTNFFSGSIDDLRVYNRPIDESEVLALYNEGICVINEQVTDELTINLIRTSYNPISYQNSIKIYPNPTKDEISIDFGNLEGITNYSLNIYNSQGQQVYSNIMDKTDTNVDLTTFGGPGLYIIIVKDQNGFTLKEKKIILQ